MRSDLSRREREILEIIYQRGECTANEIQSSLHDDLANATVRTQLRSLEAKGAVEHRRVGKQYVYQPSVPRTSAAISALRRVVDVFFKGSMDDALAAHLADPKTKLSDDEVKRLRRLLNHHARGEKK